MALECRDCGAAVSLQYTVGDGEHVTEFYESACGRRGSYTPATGDRGGCLAR